MLQQCEYLVEPASLVTLYVCVSRCKLIVLAWSVYAPAGIVRRWEAGRVSAKQSLYPRPPCSFSIKMSACVLNTPAYMWQLPDILLYPAYRETGRQLRLPMIWPIHINFYFWTWSFVGVKPNRTNETNQRHELGRGRCGNDHRWFFRDCIHSNTSTIIPGKHFEVKTTEDWRCRGIYIKYEY